MGFGIGFSLVPPGSGNSGGVVDRFFFACIIVQLNRRGCLPGSLKDRVKTMCVGVCGEQAPAERQAARHRAAEKIGRWSSAAKWFELKSLIMAQIERWRYA